MFNCSGTVVEVVYAHVILYGCVNCYRLLPWKHWSRGVTDCYHKNAALSPLISLGVTANFSGLK